jgi:hypothetical protein
MLSHKVHQIYGYQLSQIENNLENGGLYVDKVRREWGKKEEKIKPKYI